MTGFRATAPAVCSVAVSALALAGCVAPAPDTSAYASKAAMTAKAVVSAARTAVLAEDAYVRGRLTGPYLETVVVDAEHSLGSVQTTFDSIQPPATERADDLRAALDPLLDEAGAAVTDLRIAARRGETAELIAAADALSRAADRLETFARDTAG